MRPGKPGRVITDDWKRGRCVPVARPGRYASQCRCRVRADAGRLSPRCGPEGALPRRTRNGVHRFRPGARLDAASPMPRLLLAQLPCMRAPFIALKPRCVPRAVCPCPAAGFHSPACGAGGAKRSLRGRGVPHDWDGCAVGAAPAAGNSYLGPLTRFLLELFLDNLQQAGLQPYNRMPRVVPIQT